MTIPASNAETADAPWKSLYRIGGVGGLVAGTLIVIDLLVFMLWPQPSTIDGWFGLFRRNWLVGLLDLDLLGMIAYVFTFPIVLSLYFSLRRTSQSWMSIATTLTFVGISAYFASNTALSMLSLSNQYAAATTDAQRSILLAAGQAMLALFLGPAFTESYILVSSSLLITAIVMLLSKSEFSGRTAYVGILANLAGVGQYVPIVITSLALGITNCIALGVWFILIGRRLLRSGEAGSKVERNPK